MAATQQLMLATKPVVAGGTPTVTSAVISLDGMFITFNLSISCTTGAGGNGGMSITASGGVSTLTYSSGSGSSAYVYSLSRRIFSGETITRTYVQPGNGIEATSGSADLASFVAQAVTNGSGVIAVDDFNRADSADLGANWDEFVGAIGIVSNEASYTGSGVGVVSYNAVTPASNARASFELRTAPSASTTLAMYLRDDGLGNGGYSMYLTDTALTIDKEPTSSTIASATVTFNIGDIVSFETNGSAISVYKNGVSVLSVTDSSFTIPIRLALAVSSNAGVITVAVDNFLLQNV